MKKRMKIGPRFAIITSAMILAGSMAACGNTKDTDNKITTATVTDASVMDGSDDVADKKGDASTEDKTTSEKATTEKKNAEETTEQEASGKADTTEKPSNSKPSTTESKPATTQAPSNNKPSTTESKPNTTESKPTTTQVPSTTQAPSNNKPSTTQTTTEAAKDHSWVYSWKEKKENVKIADEWSYPEMAAANHCRACGQDSLARTWNGNNCPYCGECNYSTTSDMPTGNMITEPAIYQEQVVGYTCTIKCSRCGETRTFECDANKNGNINTSGKCK